MSISQSQAFSCDFERKERDILPAIGQKLLGNSLERTTQGPVLTAHNEMPKKLM